MEPAHEIGAAQLLDLQGPAHGPEFQRLSTKTDHPVTQAVEVRVALAVFARQVVHQDDGDVLAREELLQREDLAAITQGVLRQEAHLGKTVEHDPRGPNPVDLLLDEADRAAQFELPGMQDRLFAPLAQHLLRRGQLKQLQAFKGPPVRCRYRAKLLGGLRERDIEGALALADPLQEEPHRERGLA